MSVNDFALPPETLDAADIGHASPLVLSPTTLLGNWRSRNATVSQIDDLSGNGRHFTQATGARQAAIRQIQGYQGLYFEPIGAAAKRYDLAANLGITGDHTLLLILFPTLHWLNVANIMRLVSNKTTISGDTYLAYGELGEFVIGTDANPSYTADGSFTFAPGPIVLISRRSGTTPTLRANRRNFALSGGDHTALTKLSRFGGPPDDATEASYPGFTGFLLEAAAWNSALSDAEVEALETWAYTQYVLPRIQRPRVIEATTSLALSTVYDTTIVRCNSTAARTHTLQALTGDGKRWTFFQANTGLATIDASGSETFTYQDGSTSTTIALSIRGHRVTVEDIGSTWLVIEESGVRGSVATGITAGTTQTQAGATQLSTELNFVDTVGVENDGVKLVAATPGIRQTVVNRGANTLKVYPATADDLGAGVNLAVTLAAGFNVTFAAVDTTNWVAVT